ncbi:hypothetical protein PCANC_12683 [Puccinia coronata f. sp. avenae]|uniref:tRNA dimethylallyltransferase n=1 Tax=Puccinia coronata f. sp. avenae TaxID=200324 RepID=A0A2N5SY55_9BASI|nr:hypothetical protein PCANC_12683 [Puccinia coronata f. sp. avenae]
MRRTVQSIVGAIRSMFSRNQPPHRDSHATPRPDLVVILGTTGTGKSKLAIELASALSPNKTPEIINGDSMQVYKGLDLLTNKITTSETNSVPHHLMSFLDLDQDFTVERFRDDAIKKIAEIHQKGSLPIVVGGTGYYIQNLILPGRLSKDISPHEGISERIKKDIHATKSAHFSSILDEPSQILKRCQQNGFDDNLISRLESIPHDSLRLLFLLPHLPPFSSPKEFPPGFPCELLPLKYRPPQASPEEFCIGLHETLQAIDPVMAGRWHWRDLRKVRRSLEVALCTGKLMSQLVAEQDQIDKQAKASCEERVPYRTLVFWLYSETERLVPRLDARVDKMIENGLMDEVRDLKLMREKMTEGNPTRTDFSRGPFQAIGYREFESLVSTTEAESTSTQVTSKEVAEATELMKIATRQYAKSQVKWMKNKLLPEMNSRFGSTNTESPMMTYILDASKVEEWEPNVLNPAKTILSAFLNYGQLPSPKTISSIADSILSESETKKTRSLEELQLRVCEICTTEVQKPLLIEELRTPSPAAPPSPSHSGSVSPSI